MPGVYVAYPFCAQKCTYCNFASGVFPASLETAYLDALAAEIRSCEWPWTPETVYWGGGTPSLIDPARLSALHRLIPGCPWHEATIEVSPGTLTEERVSAWSRAGIDRVSLGVQSFVETEIRRTARKHTAETVANDVRLLRAAGIENFNIDLIAGLAGQTADSWEGSLDLTLALDPPHVSVYMFEVDEDSRLGREVLLGGFRYFAADVPDSDLTAALYERAVERLTEAGIPRYEISNFARPGFESKHNLKYWRSEPYLGFGCDAHSFDGTDRHENSDDPADYVRRIETGGSARIHTESCRLNQEKFFVGLRLAEGVSVTEEDWRRYGPQIRHHIDAGLLESAGARLRLTSRGILLSNEVFEEFIEA